MGDQIRKHSLQGEDTNQAVYIDPELEPRLTRFGNELNGYKNLESPTQESKDPSGYTPSPAKPFLPETLLSKPNKPIWL